MGYKHIFFWRGESHCFNKIFLKTVSDPKKFESIGRDYINNSFMCPHFSNGFTIYQQVKNHQRFFCWQNDMSTEGLCSNATIFGICARLPIQKIIILFFLQTHFLLSFLQGSQSKRYLLRTCPVLDNVRGAEDIFQQHHDSMCFLSSHPRSHVLHYFHTEILSLNSSSIAPFIYYFSIKHTLSDSSATDEALWEKTIIETALISF